MRFTFLILICVAAASAAPAQQVLPDTLHGIAKGMPWTMKLMASAGNSSDQYLFDLGPLLSNRLEVAPADTGNKSINLSLRSFDLQLAYQYFWENQQLKLISVRKKTAGAIWDKYVEELTGSFPPTMLDRVESSMWPVATCLPQRVLAEIIGQFAELVDWPTVHAKQITIWHGQSALGPYQVQRKAWMPGDYQREQVLDIWWPERHIRLPVRIDARQVEISTHLMKLTYYKNDKVQVIALRASAASSLRLELITLIQQMQGKTFDSTMNWQQLAIEQAAILIDKSLVQTNPMLFYHLTLPEDQGGCGFPSATQSFSLSSTDWFFLGYPTWWYPVAYAASNIIHKSTRDWVHTVSIGRGVEHPLPYQLTWQDDEKTIQEKLHQFGWQPTSNQQWEHPATDQITLTTYIMEQKLQRIAVSQVPYPAGLEPAIPQMVNRFDEVFLTLLTLHAADSMSVLSQFSQGDNLCPVGFQKDTISLPSGRYQCFMPRAYSEKLAGYSRKLQTLLPAAYVMTETADTLLQRNPRQVERIIQQRYRFTVRSTSPFIFQSQKRWPTVIAGFDAHRDAIYIAFDPN